MLKTSDYIFAAFLAFTICLFFVPVLIWVAKKFKILDKPNVPRKIHKKATPLLGGFAIFMAVNLVVALYYFASTNFSGVNILPKYLLGITIGSFIIMLGGFLDDKFGLKPSQQLIFPVLAVSSVIISGIGIDSMTNPFNGGIFQLDKYISILFWFKGLPYKITILADLFTLIWLLGMMYTTKLMDGLDGLVSGVSLIGALFIFITSLNSSEPQTDVALLSIILAACLLAFLAFNFNPAKIFLGEGGSLYAGFMLGVLSIISGSKVAVTLILMGIPILDVLWTILRRMMEGHNPFKTADKKHLHHRLLAAGFSVRQAVFVFYGLSFIFGLGALFLQKYSFGLLILGIFVLIAFILLVGYLYKLKKEKGRKPLDE